jgi:hypothetical protein
MNRKVVASKNTSIYSRETGFQVNQREDKPKNSIWGINNSSRTILASINTANSWLRNTESKCFSRQTNFYKIIHNYSTIYRLMVWLLMQISWFSTTLRRKSRSRRKSKRRVRKRWKSVPSNQPLCRILWIVLKLVRRHSSASLDWVIRNHFSSMDITEISKTRKNPFA